MFDRYAAARQAANQLRESGFGDSVYVTDEIEGESTSTAPRSRDEGGILGSVRNFFSDLFGSDEDDQVSPYAEAVKRGGAVVKVEVDEEERAEAARQALEAAGAVDIDERMSEWRASGWREGTSLDAGRVQATGAGPDAEGTAATSETTARTVEPQREVADSAMSEATSESGVLPVVREELKVGKRLVRTGGVRVYARTVETPVQESVALRREQAEVERRPVDRPASEADLQGLGSRTIEVTETAEEPVVEKEARVVEEVRVGKRADTRVEQVQDTVRRTDVEVENLGAEASGARPAPETADADMAAWRSHFDSTVAAMGGTWDEYEPAYRWGHRMRSEPGYAGRSWDESESSLRGEWERSQSGPWERFKAAVRHAWDRMTA